MPTGTTPPARRRARATTDAGRAAETAPGHRRATARLGDEIAEQRALGRRVPCVDGPLNPDYWVDEDPEHNEAAARACLACPALAACDAAGRFEHGNLVMAGQIRTGSGHRPSTRRALPLDEHKRHFGTTTSTQAA